MCLQAATLHGNPPPTLGMLHEILGAREADWPYVIGLVSHGWVEVDQSRPIDRDTPVLACRMSGAL